MIDRANQEEIFYKLSRHLDKDDAEKLTSEISVYFLELYKKQICRDLELFESELEKEKKRHIDTYKSDSDRNILLGAFAKGVITSLEASVGIWKNRFSNLQGEMIEVLKENM